MIIEYASVYSHKVPGPRWHPKWQRQVTLLSASERPAIPLAMADPVRREGRERGREGNEAMEMPDMNESGPFCMDPVATVWTLVGELVKQQRSVVQVERMLAAMQAEHADQDREVLSLAYDLKNVCDLAALRELWYTRTLPSMVAQLALALEVHETFGDGTVRIDDPIDASLWRSKYFVAMQDMTASRTPDRKRA